MTKPCLLAVDDDPVNLEIIGAIFEAADIDIVYAHEGLSALRILESDKRCDLVLLDRMMPEVDGLTVLRRMKATPRLAAIPVIMQTAAAAPEDVAEGLRAGAYYYLTKPYTPDAVRTIVAKRTARARAARRRVRGHARGDRGVALDRARFVLGADLARRDRARKPARRAQPRSGPGSLRTR